MKEEVQEKEINLEEVNEEEMVEQQEIQEEKKDTKKGIFKKKEDTEKIKLQEENAVLKDKLLRTTAEMQNMRRRMEEEKAAALKFEGEDLIKKLLPVIDNFERAINADESKMNDDMKKYLSGFKMIYANLNNTLESYDVKTMDVLNKDFDATSMEAVMVEEVEGVVPNTVIDVLQKGYTYKGKIVRYAMVKVSK